MDLCRSLAHSLAPGRDSQRISLRASQAQQLGRESLFEGFTYEGSGKYLPGDAIHLRAAAAEEQLVVRHYDGARAVSH